MKISFCTVCMGRQHHLAQVYPANIQTALTYPEVEFVLLDYHSPDRLMAWVQSDLAEWRDRGVLKYFRTTEPAAFHVAHAKNVAHRLASGDVLVNLDADNSFHAGFAEEIAGHFANGTRAIARFGGSHPGCTGRIALRRDDFLLLGGYDEDLIGWGYEDEDLIARARRLGLVLRYLGEDHAQVIPHNDQERLRFVEDQDKVKSDARNRALSQEKLRRGQFIANPERQWGTVRLEGELPHP